MDVVHCFQMALKRLRNLFEIVDAERARVQQQGAAGSSSDEPGGSSDNPMVV